jgi:2-polyprenyl-3-methyl-5-hydroxy-6-metoxy-1,4-benzoquinol methylase
MNKDLDSLREKVAADYDAVADEWDRTRQAAWGEFSFLGEMLKQTCLSGRQVQHGKLKILDAGCGNGRLVKWLDAKLTSYEYLGVDNSVELLKKAQQNCPVCKFQKADLVEFCQPESFDLVTCVAVLHHLPSRDDRLRVLYNLKNSLKPGGRLFLTVWNLWQPRYLKYVLKSYLTGQLRECQIPFARQVSRYVHAFTASELLGLLEQAGFSQVDVFGANKENKAGVFSARNIVAIVQR